MKTRTKDCPTCGNGFSYEIGKGRDKKHCSPECRVKAQIANRESLYKAKPPCLTAGCDGKATRVTHGMCETCYYRVRRNGTTEARKISGRYKTGAGYIKLLDRDHPLADSGGHVFEHRAVAFRANDGNCPDCYWCGTSLEWPSAVIDHLDENKENNAPTNLVVACNDCNRSRGAILPFIKRMKPGSLTTFIMAAIQYNTKCHDEGKLVDRRK